MSIIDDMLNKANKRFEEEKKSNLVVKEIGEVTPENNEELKNIMKFIKECGFSSLLLEINSNELKLILDENLSTKGLSANSSVFIKNENDRDTVLHELIHQASSNFETKNSGIRVVDDISTGEALNEGITEYVARTINPNYIVGYEAPYLIAKHLIDSFGIDVLKGYFEADRKLFESSFGKENIRNIKEIIYRLDIYLDNILKVESRSFAGIAPVDEFYMADQVWNLFEGVNNVFEKMNIEPIDTNEISKINGDGSRGF